MKTLAILVMSFLALPAHGSRPIMEDEALACISGGMPNKPGEMHTVSFNNRDEIAALLPDTLAAATTLKSAEQHSAIFKIDGIPTQTINFSFRDFPGSDVCFRYDNRKEIWLMSRTERDMCGSCFLKSDGT